MNLQLRLYKFTYKNELSFIFRVSVFGVKVVDENQTLIMIDVIHVMLQDLSGNWIYL